MSENDKRALHLALAEMLDAVQAINIELNELRSEVVTRNAQYAHEETRGMEPQPDVTMWTMRDDRGRMMAVDLVAQKAQILMAMKVLQS